VLVGGLVLQAAALASPALAHESPHGLQLLFTRPEANATPIVLTNRGVIFPVEGAAPSYSLRCNESYGVNTAQVPHLVLDPTGGLVVASVRAVETTSDSACTFTPSTGLPKLSLGGFAQVTSAPNRLLTTTQVYEQPAKVFASEDYGHTWSELATNHTLAVYEALLASSDGQRLFASGHRYDMPNKKLLSIWGTSSDGGKTWVDQDLASDRFPLGFHPSDPQVVFAREPVPMRTIDPRDRILRSSDGGATFEVVQELPPVASFSSTPDGSSIWLGSQTEGLWRSTDGGKTFARVQEDTIMGVYCLQYRQDRLWACTRMAPNTGGIWSSDDRGTTWNKLYSFEQITSQVSCRPGPTPQEVCEQPWKDWTYELLTNFEDAGVPPAVADAGSDAGALVADSGTSTIVEGVDPVPELDAGVRQGDAGASTKSDDGGCSAIPGQKSGSASLLFGLAMLTWLRRRRLG